MVSRILYLCSFIFVSFWNVLTGNEFENPNIFHHTPMEEGQRDFLRTHLKENMYKEEIMAAAMAHQSASSIIGRSEEHSSSPLNVGIVTPPRSKSLQTKEDHHKYYNTSFIMNPKEAMLYWIDMDKLSEDQVVVHSMLSDSHRRAAPVLLSFKFPFYGHLLRNITLATGGFLYMGDYLHSWIAATQYIAPLMANFDTTIANDSVIKYADNGSTCTFQWDKVYIQDREKDGAFTFQVTLFSSGDIVFAYKEIPFSVSEILDEKHPVTIGISDAYIRDQTIFFIRKKTIVEYHKISKMSEKVSSGNAIYFSALPTCLGYHLCQSCMSSNIGFNCLWCDAVQRCSDGIDRYRQDWIENGCEQLKENIVCPKTKETPKVGKTTSRNSSVKFPTQQTNSTINFSTSTTPRTTTEAAPKTEKVPEITVRVPKTTESAPKSTEAAPKTPATILSTSPFTTALHEINSVRSEHDAKVQSVQEEKKEIKTNVPPGVIILIIIVISLMICLGMWLFYAYRFPQSVSGQFLIKYRPKQWNFKWRENEEPSLSGHM